MAITALVLLLCFPLAQTSWIDDAALRRVAMTRTPATPRHFKLDLDLPAEQRWVSIYSDPLFKNAATDVEAYFAANIPKWTIPIITGIVKGLRGHFHDYADEMVGIARTLKADIGTIVLVNLVYALEQLAGNDCTLKNTTGPCKKHREGPGLCTSVVAEAADGSIWHGRNLDWNLPSTLRKYVFDVDFTRGGQVVFRGTTVAGLVGALHGLRPGGFSVSIDARNGGGNSLWNLLRFVSGKYRTDTHLLREVLETRGDFDAAVRAFSETGVVQPVYFIVGGASRGQAAVVARDRRPPARDVWLMNETAGTAAAPAWFLLQTNYDRWEQPPAWDDRRTPGNAHMQRLGQAGVSEAGLSGVMHEWPTFNNHTDITGVMGVTHGSYRSIVWMDGLALGPAPAAAPAAAAAGLAPLLV